MIFVKCDGCGRAINTQRDHYYPVTIEKEIEHREYLFLMGAYCDDCHYKRYRIKDIWDLI